MLHRRSRINYLTLAFLTLGYGYLVIFLGRPGPVFYFIHEHLEREVFTRRLHVEMSNQLASFIQVYAIILLSLVLIDLGRTGLISGGSGWMSAELFFEK